MNTTRVEDAREDVEGLDTLGMDTQSLAESARDGSDAAESAGREWVPWDEELRRARSASFAWTNYPQLRAASLFKPPFQRDVWQPKLTLKVPMTAGWGRGGRSGRAAAAVKMHAKLQSLCGDRQSARPRAVNIGIIHGIVSEFTAMGAELWLQLLRQTNSDPGTEACVKAWGVAAFAASTTLVPPRLLPFLLHELQARRHALSGALNALPIAGLLDSRRQSLWGRRPARAH